MVACAKFRRFFVGFSGSARICCGRIPVDFHTMSDTSEFPSPPVIAEAQMQQCRDTDDFSPVLFEWYKYIAVVANFFACLRQDSPAVRNFPHPHYAALVGLLNRCSRLMHSNVVLSHEGLFGETTAILDRCIFETSVRIVWLCRQRTDDAFARFFAEGLKTELALKVRINANIAARGTGELAIERRMLGSVQRCIQTSGLTDAQIEGGKKLPDLAAMIESLKQDRLMYIVGQKLGSHHVHGTWPSLLFHYLDRDEDGTWHPRDHNCPTHVNQYVFVPLVVLSAVKAFIEFVFDGPEDIEPLRSLIESIEQEIVGINHEAVGTDYELAEEI